MARDKETLLRQYELMVNSANQVTNWRQTTNNFYLAVNTTLLAVATYLYGSAFTTSLIVSLIGIAISFLWHQNINYFRKLNEAKFKVIHRMEKDLPVAMFHLEYEHLKTQGSSSTQIEKNIPILFAIAYGVVLLLQLLSIYKVI